MEEELKEYTEHLFSHLRTLEYFHENGCYDIVDVLINLFDENVEVLFEFTVNDYNGSVFVAYKYKDKYFYVQREFGSCNRDDWNGDSDERHVCLEMIKYDIISNLVSNIYEITYPLEMYSNLELKHAWSDFLRKEGTLELSLGILYKKHSFIASSNA